MLLNHVSVRPHLGSGRKIQLGQKIHGSVMLLNDKVYTPKACPVINECYERSFWERLRTGEEKTHEWLELDLGEHIENMVQQLINQDNDDSLQSLRQIIITSKPAVCFLFSRR